MRTVTRRSWTSRKLLGIALVGVCLLSAGCAGLGPGGNATDGAAPPENDTIDAGSPETATAANGSDSAASNGSVGDADSTPAGNGHGNHSHGNHTHAWEDGTENRTQSGDGGSVANASLSGKVTVVVEASELDPAPSESSTGFDIAASDEHTWLANESMTLATALSSYGVEAGADSLRYGGESYEESTEGTTISYRVDGEPVDPTAYRIEDGDQIWVTVTTDETNASAPGNYIKAAQQHVHGQMNVTVDGETIDFSREKFQSNHQYFHYEGGGGEEWHAHSWNVTLEWALSSLADIEADADSFTYNGTTYSATADGTTITYEVNGQPVDPGEYRLKDGDAVHVVIESDG